MHDHSFGRGYNCDPNGRHFLSVPGIAPLRTTDHASQGAFLVISLFRKCNYRNTIARCSMRKDPCINRRAAESRAGRNRSRMTIDHKSAFAVSDTVLLTQRLRQG
jgi:hypothetical protein